jgi:hypothetical protein
MSGEPVPKIAKNPSVIDNWQSPFFFIRFPIVRFVHGNLTVIGKQSEVTHSQTKGLKLTELTEVHIYAN